jgi:hypothetical protein
MMYVFDAVHVAGIIIVYMMLYAFLCCYDIKQPSWQRFCLSGIRRTYKQYRRNDANIWRDFYIERVGLLFSVMIFMCPFIFAFRIIRVVFMQMPLIADY